MEGRMMREVARNVRSEVFLVGNVADFAGNKVAAAKVALLTTANAAVAAER